MLEKCPVCLGNGLVPNGFYSTTRHEYDALVWVSGTTEFEKCHSCRGRGYIKIPSESYSNLSKGGEIMGKGKGRSGGSESKYKEGSSQAVDAQTKALDRKAAKGQDTRGKRIKK